MANDNTLATQQDAMASETDSTPDLPGTLRKSPYQNAYTTVLDLIAAQSKQWAAEEPAGDTLDTALSVLETLRSKVQTMHDEPRDANTVGSWYVGTSADGTRTAFKSPTIPSEKSASFAKYVRVFGKFHTENGASFRVKHGIKADDTMVFSRKASV